MAESLAAVNESDDNVKEIDVENTASRKATQMPKPTGYKILIALPEPDEKTDGGIIKASQTIHTEEVGALLALFWIWGQMFIQILHVSRQVLFAKKETGS